MDELTCLLMDTAKLLKSNLTKSLKPYNLTCRQAIVLKAVKDSSKSAKSISQECSMDKATLSVVLDKLIKNDYIVCRQNEDDKRENVYTATKAGQDILPDIDTIETACMQQLRDVLNNDDYSQMIDSLIKIGKSLELGKIN